MQPNDPNTSGHRPFPDDVPSLDAERLEVPSYWDPLDPAPLDDTERHELERFLDTGSEGLEVSDDFVANTFARVLADQEEIRREAELADDELATDEQLSEVLAQFRVPEPSAEFVETTLRNAVPPASTTEEELTTLLRQYGPEQVSPDFVERTLDALNVDRSPLRLVRPEGRVTETTTDEPAPIHRPRWTLRGAVSRLAGAAVLTAGVVLLAQGGTDRKDDERTASTDPAPAVIRMDSEAVSAASFAPAPVGQRLGRIDDDGLELDPIDPLHAAFGFGDAEGGR